MKLVHWVKVLVVSGVVFLYAQNAAAFSISPLRYRATLNPGTVQPFTITVSNDETSEHRYQIMTASIRSTEDGQRTYEHGGDAAERWVEFPPEVFRLKPRSKKLIEIKISVPPGSEPGLRPLALLVRSESLNDKTVGITAEGAIPLLLTVAGLVNENLTAEIHARRAFEMQSLWPLAILLHNNGSVSVSASGTLAVSDWLGHELASQTINFGSTIFPRSIRNREIVVRASDRFLWPGPYKAMAKIEYGRSGTMIEEAGMFWYVPQWAIVGSGAGLILLTSALWYIKKGRPHS